MSSQSLKETTVAITGAAGGLGKAIAKAFLDAGSNVAICDVNQQRLSETEDEWKQQYPGKYIVSQTDITDEASVEAFVSSVVSTFGSVDVLVNNAGVMDSFDPVGTLSKETWDRVIGINLTGQFLCTKAAVNAMTAPSNNKKGGVIISIGSVASARGFSSGAAYTASKHGLLGLVRSTAGFYGDQGVSSIALLIGAMPNTNIAEGIMTGAQRINQEAMGQIRAKDPSYGSEGTTVGLAEVASYCLFFADKGIAATANGTTVDVSKNWPAH